MVLDYIAAILHSCRTSTPLCPPDVLFNEQWLLRVTLDWLASHPGTAHPLTVPPNARWFTDARLRTVFQKRHPDDQLAEKRVRVDGVIGDFDIRVDGKSVSVVLHPDARVLVVIVARLFRPLGGGIKAARYFDEAARTVAAVTETLRRANCYPVDMDQLGFYVLAPEAQIASHAYAEQINREAIRQKARQRVAAYGKTHKEWYSEWFRPTLEQITIDTLSWEALLHTIQQRDPAAGQVFDRFYQQCLQFN